MRVIYTAQDLGFLPKPNEERLVLSTELPPLEHCTAVIALAFDGDRILLNHNKRWKWSLPGGHLEKGEPVDDAVRREVYEETRVKLGEVGVLGYTHFHISGPRPPEYRYPYPDSYMVYFWAQIESLDPFEETSESWGRRLVTLDEWKNLDSDFNRELYEAASKAVIEASNST